MNPVLAFLAKVFLYVGYKRDEYLFWRSKKYIISWGEGTYGIPSIVSYDQQSTLSVGSYCSIASNVSFLLGANHKRGMITTYPISKLDVSRLPTDSNEPGGIEIGSDVWVGYGATIIGPVKIGDGAIIGAHALVLTDVPPYAVVGGVPAKVLKYRFEADVIEALLSIKWWDWNKETIIDRHKDIYSDDHQAFIQKYKL